MTSKHYGCPNGQSLATGRPQKMSRGCNPGISGHSKTLAALVLEYQESQKVMSGIGWNPLKSLLEAYWELPDLEKAVTSALHAEDLVGKSYRVAGDLKVRRHGHQRRIKKEAMGKALKKLTPKIQELEAVSSFEELYECICANCKISGLGPLYLYDTSLRIGAYLKLKPKQVYLQAGALLGARALGLDVKKSPLPLKVFREEMRILKPHEIEDFLCIYKDQLGAFKI
jgi:hypothetical protein